jgi:hypothetical protein
MTIMVNFLRIENNGLITAEDLKYIGSSTKRGNDTKIGQFGSGWKFALAWILRNDLSIRIFSGLNEIVVDFEIKNHRDNLVKVLTVDGQETSITSGMGEIDWKGWMALREIVSNAIDEGGEKVSTLFNPEIIGIENKTSIFIEMNGELADILRNFDSYFAFERKPSYSHDGFKLYKKSASSQTIVFRKGIRCWERANSSFDFCFDNITINESRLSSDSEFYYSFKKEFRKIKSPTIFLDLLKEMPLSALPDLTEEMLPIMVELLQTNKFKPRIAETLAGVLISGITIPDTWYTKLRDLGLMEDIFEQVLGKKSTNGNFYILEEHTAMSKKLSYELSAVLPISLVIVKFLDDSVCAFKDGVFYLSEKSVSSNLEEVFATLMYSSSRTDLQDYFKQAVIA